MPVHFRRYFQLVEKKSADVNPIWKVLHAAIFTVIVVLSFAAAYSFHDVYDSFSYHCILYAKPKVRLGDIEHITTTTFAPSNDSLDSDLNITTTATTVIENPMNDDTTITPVATNTTLSVTEVVPEGTTKPGPGYQIINYQFWVVNSTLKARVYVDYRETVFGSKGVCNTVLFFPLATLVLTTFTTVIVMICGRGGRGYESDLFPQPWLYVYPLLIYSTVMLIISCIVARFLSNGMQQYCAGFRNYTGEVICTENINYFPDDSQLEIFDLYRSYNICLISSSTVIILWALQVVLIILRVICVVDFDLIMVTVTCKRRHSIGLDVHEALTKSHKLKKVSFNEKKFPHKDDDDDDVTQV